MEGIFIAWLVGMAWQLSQAQLWPAASYAVIFGCATGGLVLWFYQTIHKPIHKTTIRPHSTQTVWAMRLCLWCLIGTIGFAWAGWLASQKLANAIAPELEVQDLRVTGIIDALPQLQPGRLRFTLNVKHTSLEGETVKVPPRIMLSWYYNNTPSSANSGQVRENQLRPIPEIHVGQEWALDVRLRAPHGNMNPHGFDYELWLWEQGIGAVGYVRDGRKSTPPELLRPPASYGMEHWREVVRAQIMRTVAPDTPEGTPSDTRTAGLIAALTLGDQRAIDRDDWKTFRATGVAHLVSISGLHITMMAWLVYCLVSRLWRCSVRLMLRLPAHMAALAAGLFCAWLYAWFAGWGIPAQRTVLMLATVVVLRFAGVRWPWYSVWLLVAVVVVAVDPWALLQAGFWLSFIAVGVLLAQSQQAEKTDIPLQIMPDAALPLWRRAIGKLGQNIWQMLWVQWRISIALAPLTLLLFQQVSIVGFIANLFAIPWVTFVMVPLALGGIFFNKLWGLAAWAGDILLRVLEWLSDFSWSVWESAVPPLPLALLAVMGGIALVLPMIKGRYRLLGLLAILPALLWQPTRPAPGEFDVLALDVGQGSAVVVRTATHALLFDTGPKYNEESDAGTMLVVPALRAQGVNLDRIIVSHADSDHAGGLNALLQAYPQADLMLSAPAEDAMWQSAATQKQPCVAGASWQWDEVQFTVLHPFEAVNTTVPRSGSSVRGPSTKTNAQSCVLHISTTRGPGNAGSAGKRAVLLTGDIENAQERAVVKEQAQAQALLQADVLFMPHHGSKSSSSIALIDAVNPKWAIAQAGYLNRFGHPATEVVQRYVQKGVQVIDTPRCGAALWRSNTPDAIQCERQERKRYWHHQIAPSPL